MGGLLAVVFGACVAFVLGIIGFAFYQHTWVALQVLGGIAVIAGVVFLGIRARDRAWDRRYAAMAMPGYQEPEPGLIRSYLKAKKDKVCFLVEFVNPRVAALEDGPCPSEAADLFLEIKHRESQDE